MNKVKLAITDFLQTNPTKTAKDVTVACYGLAFKPDIDDLRESPALNITKKIVEMHAGTVLVVEPNITKLPDVYLIGELVSADYSYVNADIHIMLVDHQQFKLSLPPHGVIIDTKGIWDK